MKKIEITENEFSCLVRVFDFVKHFRHLNNKIYFFYEDVDALSDALERLQIIYTDFYKESSYINEIAKECDKNENLNSFRQKIQKLGKIE